MENIFRKKIKLNTNMKMMAVVGAINFIGAIIICVVLYNVISSNKMEDYGSRTHNAAKVVSRFVDISKIIKYRDTLEIDDEYAEPVRLLDKVKVDLGLRYLYVESWDKTGQRFMIYDATEPGDGVMIRRSLSFQQIHEADVVLARILNPACTDDPPHISVHQDFCQDLR